MKDLAPLIDNLIAHRGLHNKFIKENSLLSIDKAIVKNIPVEIDVTMTKDKKIVLCHNRYIKKNNNKYLISQNSLKKLKSICHELVTLEEVLNFVDGKIPLLIELKPYNKGHILEKKIVELLDTYNGYFALQSFNPLTLLWLRKNRNNYVRGQLVTNNYNYNFLVNIIYEHMLFNRFTNPDFICYNIKGLPNKKIEKFRDKKIVIGWTVRSKKDLEKYRNYCDNFICENIFDN